MRHIWVISVSLLLILSFSKAQAQESEPQESPEKIEDFVPASTSSTPSAVPNANPEFAPDKKGVPSDKDQSKDRLPIENAFDGMEEYRPNYFIYGKPDTKIQFSFKFKLHEEYNAYFAYTQTMFWELGKKSSNPFSELNYNPEGFYQFKMSESSYFQYINAGYSHLSNGKDGLASRSVDALTVDFLGGERIKKLDIYFLVRGQFLYNFDDTNKDIVDYYGPINLKIYFNRVAEQIFGSEELYFEYYNGGKFAEKFSRSSYRVSLRAQPWDKKTKIKLFFQYFNGYGENLSTYDLREETYRIGLSIGGL
ncbi:MAG: phospholipase A [Bdellovibrionaceae bacterium]|nr:phospholipase A [Pseudobdellovibrionaceae bacterium]